MLLFVGFHGSTPRASTLVGRSDQSRDNYVSALDQSVKDALHYQHRGLLTITGEGDLWKALMQHCCGTESWHDDDKFTRQLGTVVEQQVITLLRSSLSLS